MSSQQREFSETRNFPAPTWAMSPDQGRAVGQMQQTQGGGSGVSGTSSSNAGLYLLETSSLSCILRMTKVIMQLPSPRISR